MQPFCALDEKSKEKDQEEKTKSMAVTINNALSTPMLSMGKPKANQRKSSCIKCNKIGQWEHECTKPLPGSYSCIGDPDSGHRSIDCSQPQNKQGQPKPSSPALMKRTERGQGQIPWASKFSYSFLTYFSGKPTCRLVAIIRIQEIPSQSFLTPALTVN